MNRYIVEKAPEPEGFGGNARVDPKRAKLPFFNTIKDGLGKTGPGAIFTTPSSDRIYVTTQASWGKQSTGKIAKGFPADTPMPEIKGYSERTKVKHGSQALSKEKGKKEESKAEHGFATKDKKDKVKNFKRRG